MMKMIIYNDDNSNNKHNNIIYIWLEYNGKWDSYQLWLMICLWGYTIKHWNVCHAKKHEPTFRDLMGYTTKKLFCVS